MPKIKIDSLTLSLLFLSLIYTPLLDTLAVFSAIFIHEFAHVLSAKIMEIEIKEIELNVLGARIKTKNSLFSYSSEIMFALSGPLTNIILFFLIYICKGMWTNDYIRDFAFCNLSLGLLNLLPIESLDGGRIISGLLSRTFSLKTVLSVTRIISFTIIFSLWLLSIYFLLRSGVTIALFAFCVALFSKMIDKEVFVT